uniref:Uncharacterized protein n=1 Tax=Candidatus Kentrum sp. MB TaxID=2138164 RepID=A0A450XKW0_9GAMM|nr:MAG: hypothetical protein BECKMB1821G_GA0114241_10568 [Candidatus Kentron sp. MB]VFK31927.1 MAG: hypothetical protein BECKMB1821I_GA0114274_102817 [Candidatus Kentron sp. MB]VFK76177.1 MAG: hypothetical protein BECKMB1821H_GA0114242_10459 [Candidatus Kentron sp. MB]
MGGVAISPDMMAKWKRNGALLGMEALSANDFSGCLMLESRPAKRLALSLEVSHVYVDR